MKRWMLPGFGGCAAVAILAVLWQAGSPAAQTSAAASSTQGEDWGSPDGGAVVIKPGATTYSVLVTDVSDNSSVFSEGRVASRNSQPDGTHSYTLKPTTPGQASWTFEVIAKPDGTAELYVTKPAGRHLVCPLKK